MLIFTPNYRIVFPLKIVSHLFTRWFFGEKNKWKNKTIEKDNYFRYRRLKAHTHHWSFDIKFQLEYKYKYYSLRLATAVLFTTTTQKIRVRLATHVVLFYNQQLLSTYTSSCKSWTQKYTRDPSTTSYKQSFYSTRVLNWTTTIPKIK